MEKAREYLSHHAVSGRRRAVSRGGRPRCFPERHVGGVESGREERSSFVCKQMDGRVGKPPRLCEPPLLPRVLEQRERGPRHGGLIFQQAGGGHPVQPPCMMHAPIRPAHARENELEGRSGAVEPVGAFEDRGGAA